MDSAQKNEEIHEENEDNNKKEIQQEIIIKENIQDNDIEVNEDNKENNVQENNLVINKPDNENQEITNGKTINKNVIIEIKEVKQTSTIDNNQDMANINQISEENKKIENQNENIMEKVEKIEKSENNDGKKDGKIVEQKVVIKTEVIKSEKADDDDDEEEEEEEDDDLELVDNESPNKKNKGKKIVKVKEVKTVINNNGKVEVKEVKTVIDGNTEKVEVKEVGQ